MALRLVTRFRVNCIDSSWLRSSTLSNYSTKDPKSDDLADHVVVADNGLIVCWHPERHFPYECSRPLPETQSEETNSVLKVQNLAEVRGIFKPKSSEMVREELRKMTYTTKHRWFPKSRRLRIKDFRKEKLMPPRDREYL